MSTSTRRYAVDHIEEGTVVLVADDGSITEVHRSELPLGLVEGAVLVVPSDHDANPMWARAIRNPAEEARRLNEAQGMLEDLRKRDRGGNVKL